MSGTQNGMAEPVGLLAPSESKSLDYDAFLSYTHRDRPVVSGIQKGLHHIGRRVGQLRALRVFRDDTDLTASPDLWGRITDALDRSRYFIVTLSPGAAQSYWVNQEISYWLEHRGLEQLLLVQAAGQLNWDPHRLSFDPQSSGAAPPALTEPGSLPAEPLYIDVSDDAPWDDRGPVFREKVTSLAAPIHGKPKDQLASDDLREQRRFRRLRAAAIAGLVLLTVAAVIAAMFAVVQRRHAVAQRNAAIAQLLDTEARSMLAGTVSGGDTRAFEELLAARTLVPNPAEGALLHAAAISATTAKLIDNGAIVHGVAYSTDGHRLASAGDDHLVRIWDAGSGQPVGKPLTGHTGPVWSVAFSPNGDRLASASSDHTVRLWDARTGDPIGKPLTGNTGSVWSVAFSPDGHLLATGDDRDVKLWNADTGQPVSAPMPGNTGEVRSVAFSPDGHRLASAGTDDNIRMWDTDTGQPIGKPLTGHTETVYRAVFSPDGHRLASASDDGSVRQWNADTGEPIGDPLTPFGQILTVAFSPDGHELASSGSDGAVRLWNADTGSSLAVLTGHTALVYAVVFSPDGRRLVSSGDDHTVRLWDIRPLFTGHTDAVTSVAFSPDGHRLASSDVDQTVRLWSADNGRPVGEPLAGPAGPVYQVAFSPDGRRLATANDERRTTIRRCEYGTSPPVSQSARL
jgi:WD40 repeat protein